MQAQDGSHAASTGSDQTLGTYALRDLITDLALEEGARITCVDAWNSNIYIGTSTGDVLHYVSIPPDPSDPQGQPSYIFATKLEPQYTTKQEGRDAGVKQILVLPDAGKACILCNGTLTFYSLPELSPAYGERIKQAGCTWIGGLDSNQNGEDSDSTVVVICLKQRLRVIRIGKEARKIRDIELGGVGAISRRADLACVAEGNAYSLLDIFNHQKHELFPIASQAPQEEERPLPPLPQRGHGQSRSVSAASPSPEPRGHDRNVSVGGEPRDNSRLRPDSASPWPSRTSSRQVSSPGEPSSRESSPAKSDGASPRTSTEVQSKPQQTVPRSLPPNIVTPTPNEFLLTTGTKADEPGIGMFINLEGDPSRGPLEFSSYPESLVLDGSGESGGFASSESDVSEGYVLAVVQRKVDGETRKVIEVQRWDVDPSEQRGSKEWLMLDTPSDVDEEAYFGLRTATTAAELSVPEISTSLRLRCLQLSGEASKADTKREAEEDAFAARFAQIQARVLLYTPDKVQWLTRNPLIVQLDQRLTLAVQQKEAGELSIDIGYVQHVLNDLRGQEARDELEFRTLTYIRQKASVLLFGNLLLQTANGVIAYESGKRLAEEALVTGELDPRIVLSLVPPLQQEVDGGEEGIWIPQALRDTITMLRESFSPEKLVQDPKGAYGDNLLAILKRYLLSWRKKKGFGSVADEAHVFRTVDAALVHVLLLLDQNTPRGPATPGSVRAEMNDVVDRGVDCFGRAVELFEQFHRLYLLSRLYQSRKMVAEVLSTWKRILEGETDAGGELIEGEHDLRRYLAKIRDQSLVQDYGAWLATRNPKLGVQIFADESARVKFQPSEAVAILKEKAPGAVKDYLEHLVFGKNHPQYVNDLIAFYLDTVLTALSTSPDAKTSLLETYTTYRALQPPKPTYRHFITDNATNEEWQHNRLRLLQLIGGSHGAASEYDVHALRERLAPYSDALVPEMIILNGREGKHEEALHLLTLGLGDYDTAIRYCLLGGSSIFHPSSSLGVASQHDLPSKEQQSHLFSTLLREFFSIPDLSSRLERTAELLERFGAWFDVGEVLEMIPTDWSVEVVSGFLVQGLRRLVVERRATGVVRALSGQQNLRKGVEVGEKIGGWGPTVVTEEVGEGG
ncbi:uncharacterized protein LTR77_010656 [Saxophila tyrrhenica]|uniref:CNH domain-containing protein n=1 Tax=Saxophila tyrrhenica TaxID=1690608 RepID=A0AAV9NYG9_9PEZI|nr:hypothetical protein LTR77_010656 [Saxophila tyrrhenica]